MNSAILSKYGNFISRSNGIKKSFAGSQCPLTNLAGCENIPSNCNPKDPVKIKGNVSFTKAVTKKKLLCLIITVAANSQAYYVIGTGIQKPHIY